MRNRENVGGAGLKQDKDLYKGQTEEKNNSRC